MRLIAVSFVLASLAASTAFAQPPSFELRDGDSVTLVGGAYIERLQYHNYFETLLTASETDKSITFRNLGWSGDNVGGHSRAVFGAPADGFKRLLKDLAETKPTVVVLAYGANEAQGLEEGIPRFIEGYKELLDEVEKHGARIVMMSPHRRENLGPPLPSHKRYNESLPKYCDAIEQLAVERGHHYVEFLEPLGDSAQTGSSKALSYLTNNGLHFSPYGYWRSAPALAALFGAKPVSWEVAISPFEDQKLTSQQGAQVSGVIASKESVIFKIADSQLPYPAPPESSPTGADLLAPLAKLTIKGLAEGKYGLQVDGNPIVAADAKHWAEGVTFRRSYSDEQIEKLRAEIHEKNTLYFHRYRPQNETYLFLFRKHEQGNNAVEIPQFDPLVEAKEKQIRQLANPVEHRFELKAIND